jgi:YHS domain-containing protein
MNSFKLLLGVFALFLGLTLSASADETNKGDNSNDAPKELKHQTHCPVMGGVIDSSVYTDIQGQRVYHCCPMCSAKLKADPDKYFKKAAEEGVLFENIQTTCPVSGEELENKSVYTDYEGRRIAFCCENCREKFDKDPEKYLDRMDKIRKIKDANKDMDHDDHSGK